MQIASVMSPNRCVVVKLHLRPGDNEISTGLSHVFHILPPTHPDKDQSVDDENMKENSNTYRKK